MSTLEPAWNATEAQAHFTDLVERALGGAAQHVRLTNGDQVVLISKAAYDALTANAREVLLRGSKGPANDPIDQAIDEGRR